MNKIRNIIVIAILLSVLSCNAFFDNPVDPESDDYQGYETVEDVNDLKASDSSGNYDNPPTLIVSKLVNVKKYKWQFSSNKYDFSNADSHYTNDNFFNTENLNLDLGTWYWRAKAIDSNGYYDEWTETQTFHLNYYTITYKLKNSKDEYYTDKVVTYTAGSEVVVDNPTISSFGDYGIIKKFSHWDSSLLAHGSEFFSPGSTIVIKDRNITLYAMYIWETKPYDSIIK